MNDFLVSIQGNKIIILSPPTGAISKEQALHLAAWIVTLADPDGEEFTKVLDEVQS